MFVVAFIVYWPGLNAPYFADDYQFVFDKPASKIFYYFTHPNKENGFYRPLQASFLAAVQAYFGMQTWPVHLTQLSLHTLLACFVYIAIKELGFSRLQAAVGAAFMLLSQINVHAVSSNDTLSQLGGTFFGTLSLWLLYCSYKTVDGRLQQRRINYGYYTAAVLAIVLSLFSKESSISFPLMAAIIIMLANKKISDRTPLIRRIIIDLFPYVSSVGIYLLVRSVAADIQPAFGSDSYYFHAGFNIVRNLAMFVFALFVPVSTVEVFSAFERGSFIYLGIADIGTAAFFVLVVSGLWCEAQSGIVILIAIFALLGLFPMVFMNHVSELYAYNSMPFVSALVGISLGRLWTTMGTRPGMVLAAVMFCILTAGHLAAVRSKVALMKDNGCKTVSLMRQIKPFVNAMPLNGRLWLSNPLHAGLEYSVFCMPGFKVLNCALHTPHLWHRPDLEMHIIPAGEAGNIRPAVDTLVLTLIGDGIVVRQQ